jgi:hypothetical protein
MEDEIRIFDRDKNIGTGAATASAAEPDNQLTAATSEDESTQNVLSDTPDPLHTEAVKPGAFGPFRYYVNQKLRTGGEVTIRHGEGPPWVVTELTMEGELRLSNPVGEDFALVPLDQRCIPDFFAQIL